MRIAVEDVTPVVRRPAKAVVGEHVPVRAVVWREGHDAVGATLVWRGPHDEQERATRMAPGPEGSDTHLADVVPDAPGEWTFRVDGWGDPWTTWRHAVLAKTAAGAGVADVAVDLEEGALLLERVESDDPVLLRRAAAALRARGLLLVERLRLALSDEVDRVVGADPVREFVSRGETHRLLVDRPRALVGSWYELFPRSTGGRDANGVPVHGTFATAAEELDRVASMGFDVVYLPPIHPIGEVNRKGRNNSPVALPGDTGSPWAIGSRHGGHDAVHPDLGTIEDFDAFVARAGELGLEVALDLALQCAPDHPWAVEHPEWFTTRADGTIAYAENPPKKYQDIYPLNFDNDPRGLYAEVLRVVLHWVDHGVRIFRVDNPHTKPPDFWAWLIAAVKREHPDVLFLAEAFTRPARLYGLARLGFTQNYTYFTWRTTKDELTAFGEELVARADESRPNLFVNTPDILHESLQTGGPAVFALRAALAATLSPTWGVYSGYELFEHKAVRPGSEEYLDSEKYEPRPRDYAGALAAGRSLEPWLARLNAIRAAHPALRQLRTLRFHETDNDALIAYSKTDAATGDTVLVVVTLDPEHVREGTVRWDAEVLGLAPGARVTVLDEVGGEVFEWGGEDYVKLDPRVAVAHIAAVVRS
ncbi:alpha-1,4-glucan--maltose-1-phosphate maltosyltransferase [Umezawaea tangerina]|uniref:Alpha-1,4-glucan:maltose-1-phosphate maltosyltransferase n=1 Tax=Umezawaea tangerina TaxID=84725 RepID=A0A2T0T6F5_9PSEU|nr:alpha-1,4-glucan--maltose-1-phosphate maltosyltransferase [Umezawaea tangerina]PRY41244.1 alpha-1,4-glucan:maltose-1-phosphate maltosyltransferase [Umezawaea tangerina]